jgi:hypothetical protein
LRDGGIAGFRLAWIHRFVMVAARKDKDGEEKSDS